MDSRLCCGRVVDIFYSFLFLESKEIGKKGGKLKYRVHRIEVNSDNMQEKLEQFINKLDGDVISVIPNVRPTFQLMGATSKIDFILIVEKTK